jgi:hypothetical protein
MVTKSSSNIPTATSGTILQGQGIGVDSAFSTATYPATTVVNEVLYSSATNTVTGLATVAQRYMITNTTNLLWGNTLQNDYTFTSSTAGGTRTLTVSITDNTSSNSRAIITTSTEATGGDAVYQASTTTTVWSWGPDNSVTSPTVDPFVLAQGTALGTNNVMSVATSGEINYPLQPAFLGTLNSDLANQTGDSTVYQLGTTTALTEVFDQNSDFNTNGTFTAPVTGKYQLDMNFACGAGSADGQLQSQIVTSNRTLQGAGNPSVATVLAISGVFVSTDMDLGDTAIISGTVNGGTKTADVTTDSYFSGFLIA